jgi:hypothetical protein
MAGEQWGGNKERKPALALRSSDEELQADFLTLAAPVGCVADKENGMRPLMVLLGSAVLFAAVPAFAQNGKQIDPQTTCDTGPGSNGTGTMKKGEKGSSGNLTDKLSSCGGVLKPPAVGDDMTKPAPKTGNSRVIRPKDLPGQRSPGAPKTNGE